MATLTARARKALSRLDEHTLEVVAKSSSSMLVRMLGIAAALGVSVWLGRTLGASGLGIINLAQQVATLLLIVTMLGMDNVLIKRVAIGHENGDAQDIANSLRTASVICGLIATAATVLGILAAPWACRHIFHTEALKIPLIVTLAVLVPQTFSRIYAAALNGFRKVWQSNLVNEALSIWVVALGLVVLHLLHIRITVISAAVLYAAARLVVFLSIGTYKRMLFRYKGPRRMNARPMLKMAMPLLIASSAYIITANADGVMLGWLRSPREVGLYSVAAKVALLESFFLMVSNSAIGPKLAALYAQGRKQEMERMVQRVTGGLILIAMASLAFFILFGHPLLAIWGHDFSGAYLVLVVLGIGQFFNISTGCCGMILTMCGHERVVGYVSTSFVCVNLTLNYFLILRWGAVGAASATAITVAGDNLTKMMLARRKVGVLTLPL